MNAKWLKSPRFLPLLCLLGLLALLVARTKGKLLFDRFVYHNDLTVQFYWRAMLQDPELFPNDLIAQYSAEFHSYGIELIYLFLGYFWDSITISKWLWLVYLPCSVYFLFRLGEKYGGVWAGFQTAGLVIVGAWNKIGGDDPGDGGDFIIMFLAGFTWSLTEKKYFLTGLFVIGSFFFHPVIGMIQIVALVLALLRRERFLGLSLLNRKQIAWLGISVALCVSLNTWKFLIRDVSVFGDYVTRSQILQMPEFGPDGREPLVHDRFLDWLMSPMVGLTPHGPGIFVLLGMGLLMVLLRGRLAFRIGRPPWALMGAGAILFTASTIVLPLMFKPPRYFFQPCVIFLGFMIACNTQHLARGISRPFVREGVMVAPVLLLLAISFPYLHVVRSQASDVPLYEYLHTLPKDAMIAAHPGLANHIPIFAERSVLVSSKLSMPYHSAYYEELKRRTNDFFTAYYAEDGDIVRDFCDRYSISHIVVSSFHFNPEYLMMDRLYYPPFESAIREKSSNPKGSFLLNLPDEKKLFSYMFRTYEPVDQHTFHWNRTRLVSEDLDGSHFYTWRQPYELFVTSCRILSDPD